MARPTKYLADQFQWDLERLGLPLLLDFANVKRPTASWATWQPAAVLDNLEIRGGAFTDDSADWLQEGVLADLDALRAFLEAPKEYPLRLSQAHLSIFVSYRGGRVVQSIDGRDLEQYFNWVLLEAVRQGEHLRINRCERCGMWAQMARADSRFCSTPCRIAARRKSPEQKRATKASQKRRHYARTASLSAAPHLKINQ